MKENRRLAHVRIPHFRDRLERMLARIGRPVLCGEIALEIGCSLAHVVREMNDLVEANEYRHVEPDELRTCGMEPHVLAYTRV